MLNRRLFALKETIRSRACKIERLQSRRRNHGSPYLITCSSQAHLATHDPNGSIIFLPGGLIDPVAFANKNLIKEQEELEGWLDVLEEALEMSLAAADPDRVNVFHFTVHPVEFVGDPHVPYEMFADFLDDVVDPLVATGHIQWATFSQMADAFEEWENEHPGVDPRS